MTGKRIAGEAECDVDFRIYMRRRPCKGKWRFIVGVDDGLACRHVRRSRPL